MQPDGSRPIDKPGWYRAGPKGLEYVCGPDEQPEGDVTELVRGAGFVRAYECGSVNRPHIQRHADHDPSLICRPIGSGLCEMAPLAARSPQATG